jgi:hypothetical protein
MRTKPRRPSRPTNTTAFDCPYDDLLADTSKRIGSQRADCCVAAAAYRVLLPPTRTRSRASELLLCGHHYRQSRAALRPRGAAVFDTSNRLIARARLGEE